MSWLIKFPWSILIYSFLSFLLKVNSNINDFLLRAKLLAFCNIAMLIFLHKYLRGIIHTECLVAQLCPTLCNLIDCSQPASSVHGDSPGNNTGVGCHALLQVIFPTQGSNPGLLHHRRILYQLSYQGSLDKSYWTCPIVLLQEFFLNQFYIKMYRINKNLLVFNKHSSVIVSSVLLLKDQFHKQFVSLIVLFSINNIDLKQSG